MSTDPLRLDPQLELGTTLQVPLPFFADGSRWHTTDSCDNAGDLGGPHGMTLADIRNGSKPLCDNCRHDTPTQPEVGEILHWAQMATNRLEQATTTVAFLQHKADNSSAELGDTTDIKAVGSLLLGMPPVMTSTLDSSTLTTSFAAALAETLQQLVEYRQQARLQLSDRRPWEADGHMQDTDQLVYVPPLAALPTGRMFARRIHLGLSWLLGRSAHRATMFGSWEHPAVESLAASRDTMWVHGRAVGTRRPPAEVMQAAAAAITGHTGQLEPHDISRALRAAANALDT